MSKLGTVALVLAAGAVAAVVVANLPKVRVLIAESDEFDTLLKENPDLAGAVAKVKEYSDKVKASVVEGWGLTGRPEHAEPERRDPVV